MSATAVGETRPREVQRAYLCVGSGLRCSPRRKSESPGVVLVLAIAIVSVVVGETAASLCDVRGADPNQPDFWMRRVRGALGTQAGVASEGTDVAAISARVDSHHERSYPPVRMVPGYHLDRGRYECLDRWEYDFLDQFPVLLREPGDHDRIMDQYGKDTQDQDQQKGHGRIEDPQPGGQHLQAFSPE